jgi:hypothetical protein
MSSTNSISTSPVAVRSVSRVRRISTTKLAYCYTFGSNNDWPSSPSSLGQKRKQSEKWIKEELSVFIKSIFWADFRDCEAALNLLYLVTRAAKSPGLSLNHPQQMAFDSRRRAHSPSSRSPAPSSGSLSSRCV